jgi:hypothetical protein
MILLGAAASCSSNATPGQPLVPVATGGTGGSVLPVSDGGGLVLGNQDATAGEDSAAMMMIDSGAGGAGGRDAGVDTTRDSGRLDAPSAGPATIGDRCTSSASCTAGGVCAADVAGGGYCTADCTATGACPAGSSCVPVSDTAKICLKTCLLPTSCRSEHICLSGYCLPKCTEDADCLSSNCNVSSGVCGPSRVGNGCAVDGDCGQVPAFCDKTRPEGYCSLPCGGSMNVSCPDEANCVSGGSAGSCLKACTGPNDCRAGFLCGTDAGGTRSCIPRCSQNTDCAPGLRCDAPSGTCIVGGAAKGTLGGPCATSTDCAALGLDGFCTPEASGFPGGYCSVPCDTVACQPPGICVATSAAEHNCLSPCGAPADCRAGYTCFALVSGNGGICFPKCTTDADCRDPEPVCDLTSGYCAARPPTGGGGMANEVINLTPGGPIAVSDTVLTDRFIVTVPADAVSINFVGQAISDPTARIGIYRLEQSTDDFVTATRLYDHSSISNQIQLAPPLVPGVLSVLYPNSPSAPFTTSGPGTTVKLAIRLSASKPTSVNISAIIKHAPSRALMAGQIDLNLFFVGLPDLDATSARTDVRFKQVFDRVKSEWGQVGVAVGTVNYIDITGADAARFSDLNETDLGALMSRSRVPAAKDGALNVFFVHTITGDTLGGYIILGVSAGLPGVPLRGTPGSGLAVTTADFPDGLADLADTWAHEGGHSLGLFHTTEHSGTAFDPLPDTPECPRGRDVNQDKIVQPSECQGFGAENLMFWTGSAAIPSTKLSPNQGFVMLRNPAVH